ERLAELFEEFRREEPPQYVGIAAGRGADEEPHRPIWIWLVLRQHRGRRGQRCSERRCQDPPHPRPPSHFFNPHGSPPISCVSSTTRRSLSSCTCGEIGLPVSTLAKPHCGLIARRSRSTKRDASSMRFFRSSVPSIAGLFDEMSPSTTRLWRGTSFSGVNVP